MIDFSSIKEHEMKRFMISAIVVASVVASATAFAEPAQYGKTRAQVRAELVQARETGAFDVPDTTYPTAELRAAAAQQAASSAVANAGTSGVGGVNAGHSQSGRRTAGSETATARDNIYFGQ
jgi:hypothetical protein